MPPELMGGNSLPFFKVV